MRTAPTAKRASSTFVSTNRLASVRGGWDYGFADRIIEWARSTNNFSPNIEDRRDFDPTMDVNWDDLWEVPDIGDMWEE